MASALRSIVLYVEAGIGQDEKPYILIPVIDGEDLYAVSQLPPRKILAPFCEILDAYEYAHSNEVTHPTYNQRP
jgi:hypothetical protein